MATKLKQPMVLVTRPSPQGELLCQQLKAQRIIAHHQALFDYQAVAVSAEVIKQMSAQALVIFVSPAAVTFAQQQYPIIDWPCQQIFAVGKATQNKLAEVGVSAIAPEQQNSEGLLALAEFSALNAKQPIVIVRGDDGRELLFDELSARDAKVSYLTVYQKVWVAISEQDVQSWQNKKITVIVVTSQAILARLLQVIDKSQAYWQQCCWLVASERIAEFARQQQLTQVVNLNSANNQAISLWLQEYNNERSIANHN